jgi:hypothetical protein
MPDSPASRNGHLRVGDRVIAVNDVDILHLSHGEIVNLIKDSGLSVQLTIAPPAVAYSNLPPVDSSLHASSSLSPVPVGQVTMLVLVVDPDHRRFSRSDIRLFSFRLLVDFRSSLASQS